MWRQKLTSYFTHNPKYTLSCISVLVMICILISPVANYRLGTIFFGGVPALYNSTLAQYFFFQASSPLFGKPAPYAYHQLSRTYFIEGNLEQALLLAYRELAEYPNHLDTYYVIGLTLGYMEREEKAIDAFTKYIIYNPRSWAARNDKAWLQFRLGDIDGALRTIEPMQGLIANPWVQNTYGTLLMNKKMYDEAEVAFAHAKVAVGTMSEASWGAAYPGNDPRIYATGLEAMRTSIDRNIALNNQKRRQEENVISKTP